MVFLWISLSDLSAVLAKTHIDGVLLTKEKHVNLVTTDCLPPRIRRLTYMSRVGWLDESVFAIHADHRNGWHNIQGQLFWMRSKEVHNKLHWQPTHKLRHMLKHNQCLLNSDTEYRIIFSPHILVLTDFNADISSSKVHGGGHETFYKLSATIPW